MLPNFNYYLNDRQREAVEHEDGPLLIVAGAGSGKTRTLTARLAELLRRGIRPENIVALTFTNKAADEMRNRVFESCKFKVENCFVGTFHSLGAKILRSEAKLLKRSRLFTIFDDNDSLSAIKLVMKKINLSRDYYNPLVLQSNISRIKNELLNPGDFLDKEALQVFNHYEEFLQRNNAFDFDDLVEKVVRVFIKYPKVLEKYQRQFKYILVDEFQDVNTAQYQFVKLIAKKYQNLNVVGDDAQSIYGFRGSDFRNFLNFEKDWPNARVVKLEQNYRSTDNIVAAASAVIKNNTMQKPKKLWTENQKGDVVQIIGAADSDQEADFVAKEIAASALGKTTAVLYRTNAQSRAIEQAFIAAGIPYKIFGGVKFYERKEIKDIIAALRVAANPNDELSRDRLKKALKKDTAEYIVREMPRLSKELSILQLISFFLENAKYFEYLDKKFPNSRERIENINELIHFANEHENLNDFLEHVSLLQAADMARDELGLKKRESGVNVMTIHLAKGLEFDNVFVIGCNEGLLPHQMSYSTLDELEEERRLMYVAMTRAKKKLYLSFYHTPSRFLYEIPSHLTNFISLTSCKDKELPDEEEIYIDDW